MDNFLFINTNFLINLKDKDLKNNLKDHFLYRIHEQFQKLSKNFKGDFYEFIKNVKSPNNNSLFYIGIEDKVRQKFKSNKKEIENFFPEFKNFNCNGSYFVKTKIGFNKKCSLLSVLFIFFEETFNDIKNLSQKDSNIRRLFFLFPISFDDFHK